MLWAGLHLHTNKNKRYCCHGHTYISGYAIVPPASENQSLSVTEPTSSCRTSRDRKKLVHLTTTLSLSRSSHPLPPKRHHVLTLHGSNLQTVTFNTRQPHTLHFSLGNVARPPITTTASLSLSSQPTPVAHVGRLTQLRYVPRDNCRL